MEQSYYNVYGGGTTQFPMYGAGPGGVITGAGAAAFYPYLQFGEGSGGAATGYTSGQGYGVNYPHHMFQYPAINSTGGTYPQHYGAPMSLAPSPALQSGLYFINSLLFGLVSIKFRTLYTYIVYKIVKVKAKPYFIRVNFRKLQPAA